MDLRLTGLASGFDWETLVSQLIELERAPQLRLRSEQTGLEERSIAYGGIVTQLNVLKNKVDALKDPVLFSARTSNVSDASVASTTVSANAAQGSYQFQFLQMATASAQRGTANVGLKLRPTNDVNGLVLSAAAFATPVTAGTFTVNGATVTLDTSDTLQAAFDKISAATGGAVTGSYDSTTDRVNLSSGGPIVLGSATDTSSFLQAAKLSNNGTGTVTSSGALGVVQQTAVLAAANFAAAVNDGGSGAGEFRINGVSIRFNAATDTVSDVLGRINNSTAGVIASYDSVNDRFVLANKTTGDLGIALQDVTGNFLAASGLATGTLDRGKDLLYSVNGGSQLTSHSNTITASDHGIAGLTINALKGAETSTSASTMIGPLNLVGSFGGAGAQTRVRTMPPHNLQNGYAVRFLTTGTLPSQIDSNTTYWVRRTSTTDLTLHRTAADAINNVNAINFGNSPASTGDAYLAQVDPLTGGSTTGAASTVTVTVSSDTAKVKTAISDFVTEYNKTQSMIDTETASSTDAKGKVTAGVLAADWQASELASGLRTLANGVISGLAGTLKQLDNLGIVSNGTDNTLSLSDSAKLDEALATKLNEVQDLFTDETQGLAVQLSAYLEKSAGDEGTLVQHQSTLSKQIANIDTQVADMERIVLANQQRLIDSFVAMERARAQINQQMEFLQQRLGLQS
jgi:flagellar capping protein FliD